MVIEGPYKWFMPKPKPTSQIVHDAGLRLKLVRVLRDADAKEWCAVLDVTPARWSNWETGDNPPDVTTMARAADIFGFSLDWIYRGVTSNLPADLAAEVRRRRPDLCLGARDDDKPSPDWDYRPGASARWRKKPSEAA